MMVRRRQASVMRNRGRSSPQAALRGKREPGTMDRLAAPSSEVLNRFRSTIAGEHPLPPMVALLKMHMLEAEAGRVVFGAEPSEEFYNGMGVVHGGFAATLLDSALGCAINTLAPPGKIFTSLELKVNFTRPLRREVGPVRCEARVIHMGSRVATAEGRIVDGNGKIYAHGTGTCIVVVPMPLVAGVRETDRFRSAGKFRASSAASSPCLRQRCGKPSRALRTTPN